MLQEQVILIFDTCSKFPGMQLIEYNVPQMAINLPVTPVSRIRDNTLTPRLNLVSVMPCLQEVCGN